MSKIIAAVICAAMLIAMVAGCDKDGVDPLTVPGSGPSSDGGDSPFSIYGVDFDAAFASLPPDTVMMKLGEYSVTWEEFFLYLFGNVNDILYNFGYLPPWAEALYGDTTFAQAVLEFSVDNARMYKAIMYGAAQAGISLNEGDYARMEQDYVDASESYGGEEAFLKLLWETNGCHSREIFEYLFSVGALATLYFDATYGVDGELLSEEDLAELTKVDGYLMAKHILRLLPEDTGESGEDADEENETLAQMKLILEMLDSYDGDDFDAFFDELMYKYTDDSLVYFPNGYLFQYGDMVPSFYDACSKLQIGTYSEIIESSYGYHIIYRLPIDYSQTPFAMFMQGETTSLQRNVAMGLFDNALFNWMDALEVEYTDAYLNLDLAEVFR